MQIQQMQQMQQLPQGASSSLKAGPPSGVGGVHMTMQQKKSTLPVQALVHAFHCADPACQQKTCADTKQVLRRMEVHVQQCPTRRAQRQSAQQGGPPPQQAECKVCKLWQSLHRTKSSSGQQQSVQQQQKQALQCQQNKHAAVQPVQENAVTVDARYWHVQARLVIEYGDMVSQLYERFVQQDAAGGSRQKNLAFMAPIMQILSEDRGAATVLKTQFNVEEIRKVFEVLKKITLHAKQSREAVANATAAARAGGSRPVKPAQRAVKKAPLDVAKEVAKVPPQAELQTEASVKTELVGLTLVEDPVLETRSRDAGSSGFSWEMAQLALAQVPRKVPLQYLQPEQRQQLQIQLQQQLAAAAATARQLQLSYSITIRYLQQQAQIQQLGYTQMVRL